MRLRTVARALVLAAACAFVAAGAWAQGATESELDLRLKKLETELRCLVCQNQTIADSAAGLADDLRREVRALAVAGKSDAEIKSYLVDRYGDFILYRPPVKSNTWLLWFGPLALLAGGGLMWLLIVRRRAAAGGHAAAATAATASAAATPAAAGAAPDADALARARRALADDA